MASRLVYVRHVRILDSKKKRWPRSTCTLQGRTAAAPQLCLASRRPFAPFAMRTGSYLSMRCGVPCMLTGKPCLHSEPVEPGRGSQVLEQPACMVLQLCMCCCHSCVCARIQQLAWQRSGIVDHSAMAEAAATAAVTCCGAASPPPLPACAAASSLCSPLPADVPAADSVLPCSQG
jgi:hypothetical protein